MLFWAVRPEPHLVVGMRSGSAWWCGQRLAWVLAILSFFVACGKKNEGAKATTGRSLEEYRRFRSTAVDLLGRMPTRAELLELEKPDFNMDAWIDKHLDDPTYATRMTRIYMDLLRLEPNLTFGIVPWQLYRVKLDTEIGPVYVYYRPNERRTREETDGEFCLTSDETGVIVRPNNADLGTPKKVTKDALEKATVLVKPWWLYHDYTANDPHERYGADWSKPDPEYKVADSLLKEPDGTDTTQVRICKEEAQSNDSGHIYASGRGKATPVPKLAKGAKLAPGELPPGGRVRPPPVDKPYATEHANEPVACATREAFEMSADCGCGRALERCLPSDGDGQGSGGFFIPKNEPLGPELPLDSVRQATQRWLPYWWSREVVHFLDNLFASDEDFRDILVGKATNVNGPLAQFYRGIQRINCCGPETFFGMLEEKEPLVDPSKVPADLLAHDVSVWKRIPDRGPHAAGILTMPVFLEKYASARARGAVLYNAFLCKTFQSSQVKLEPSTEPNLMVRPGCQNCHLALEPLAAYFTRIEASNFTFLPKAQFPLKNPLCKLGANGKLNASCAALYDPAFVDGNGAQLRSAYGSPAHADAEAIGGGRDIIAMPEFASCAVEKVASSFLGRATDDDDAALLESLTTDFVNSGFRMKSVVKGILRSDAYIHATELTAVSGDKP